MSHEAYPTRLPPQDLDAERQTMGSILFANKAMDAVQSVIQVDDFYLEAHQRIYQSMQRLWDGHNPVDVLTLSDDLRSRGHLQEVGGDAYLKQIVESVLHAEHAAYHAEIVRKHSLRRKAIYAAADITRNAYDDSADIEDILSTTSDGLLHLIEHQTEGQAETTRDIALRSIDRLVTPGTPGIATGFTEADGLLDGLKPAELIILAARPGIGKTAFAGSVIMFVSQFGGVFMSSIEMSNDALFDRMICSRLGVSLKELRPMARCEHGGPAVGEARDALAVLPITCMDAAEQTISSIAAAARLANRKTPLKLIVVDYLQLITPANRKENRELQVANIAWGLKCLAKQMHLPVLALAQLNREIEKRPDKTPRMSDLRESGALEQHAAVVMFLDRPGQWAPDKHEADEAVLYIAKNRGGPTGKIDLKWDGRSGTFTNHLALAAGFDAGSVDFGA